MKKLSIVLFTIIITIVTNAQGVGVGTTTPKAAFNVAENKTVLFGNDTSGAGGKMIWIPSKYAFRVGKVDENINSRVWDYDSIGQCSFASGLGNKVTGNNSIATGAVNNVKGNNALAAGSYNNSLGEACFSLGTGNRTSAHYSMALGTFNTSTGIYSTAVGISNTTSGDQSIAIGAGLDANSYSSIVLGSNNEIIPGTTSSSWVDSDPLLIVGGGMNQSNSKNVVTILKNGKAGFGTNSPAGLVHIKHNGQAANPQLTLEETQNDYSRISFKNANPGYWNIEAYSKPLLGNNDLAKLNFFYSANGYIFSLNGSGNAILTGTLVQNSDERLKKNIAPLKNSLNKLMLINGYSYQWKDTARCKDEQIGLLAQEVEKQFPQLVITGEDGKKSVAYGNMVAVLLQAIKEQQQQIDELKKLVEAKLK